MPLYEFTCKDCGKDFETILPSTDISSVVCSSCGSSRVTKKISAVGLRRSSSSNSGTIPSHSSGCGSSGFS